MDIAVVGEEILPQCPNNNWKQKLWRAFRRRAYAISSFCRCSIATPKGMEDYFNYVGSNEMKGYFSLWTALSLMCWLLVGCDLIFQAGPGLTTGRDEYLKSIKPHIAYWEREGMTEESRLEDWMACGGFRNGGSGINMQDRLPSESQAESQNRQQTDFQRCILRAGYHYTGDCSSDWAKTRPACGAP